MSKMSFKTKVPWDCDKEKFFLEDWEAFKAKEVTMSYLERKYGKHTRAGFRCHAKEHRKGQLTRSFNQGGEPKLPLRQIRDMSNELRRIAGALTRYENYIKSKGVTK